MKDLVKVYLKLVLIPFIIVEKFLNKRIIDRIIYFLKSMFPQQIKIHGLYFCTDEDKIAGRGIGLKTKEPDTIYWIDNYIKDNDIFYDIGANIGVFSLYAAQKAEGVKVYSFEPESSNYYYLNKNIYLNKFDDRILGLNIALNDEKIVSCLNLSQFIAGSSLHTFHEELDQEHKSFTPAFKQGVIGLSLDELISTFGLPIPNHIKIDVDGNEYKIINGMKDLLLNQNLKSIAIELNESLETDNQIINIIKSSGFKQIDNDSNLVNERYKNKGWPYNRYFVRIND